MVAFAPGLPGGAGKIVLGGEESLVRVDSEPPYVVLNHILGSLECDKTSDM